MLNGNIKTIFQKDQKKQMKIEDIYLESKETNPARKKRNVVP